MKKENFDEFLNTMIKKNFNLKDLINWEKIFDNYNTNEIISKFNYLFSDDEKELKSKIHKLFVKNKKIFDYLLELIGIKYEDYILISKRRKNLNNSFSLEEIEELFFKTNLKNIFLKSNNIKDIYSYFVGVKVGMDSNSRKNRSGKKYENLIESLLKKYKINYQKQKSIDNIFKGKNKKADFLMNLNSRDYIIEVNFYNTSGSKLNAITDDYIWINEKLKKNNYEFIWITDGYGWEKTKKDLFNAYSKIENLFNYSTFEKWLNNQIKKNI